MRGKKETLVDILLYSIHWNYVKMNSVFFRNPVMLQIKLKTKKTCYMSAFTLKVQLTVRDWIIQYNPSLC